MGADCQQKGSGENVMERTQLIEARIRKHWTLEKAAEQLEVDTDTVCRWEKGKTNPRGYNLQRICEVYGMSAAHLGLANAASPDDSAGEMSVFSEAIAPCDDDGVLAELLRQDLSLRLIKLVWTWPRSNHHYEELQRRIMKETEQFSSIASDAEHPMTRRDALRRLALLPAEMYGLTALSGVLRQPAEEFLPLCAASITACWYLMSGSDFTLVEHVLPHYLPRLETLAKQPSRVQKEAARLASHGHQILGVAVLQHNDVQGREQHNKQAITYATLSDDINLEVAALVRQGDTYFHSASPVLELQMFQQAAQYIHDVLPVQQANIYVGLAIAHAQCGQEQESLRYLGLANDAFPYNTQDTAIAPYAGLGPEIFLLWSGLTHLELDHAQDAWNTFASIEQLQSKSPVPERVRLQIVNHQAETAISLRDLDLFCAYLEQGIKGAEALGSQKRRSEAFDIYRQALKVWPQEAKVRALRDLFVKLKA